MIQWARNFWGLPVLIPSCSWAKPALLVWEWPGAVFSPSMLSLAAAIFLGLLRPRLLVVSPQVSTSPLSPEVFTCPCWGAGKTEPKYRHRMLVDPELPEGKRRVSFILSSYTLVGNGLISLSNYPPACKGQQDLTWLILYNFISIQCTFLLLIKAAKWPNWDNLSNYLFYLRDTDEIKGIL